MPLALEQGGKDSFLLYAIYENTSHFRDSKICLQITMIEIKNFLFISYLRTDFILF